jgi:glyoxylase-like metal-dependent hydrolase (beta-lactamase superfamily II)
MITRRHFVQYAASATSLNLFGAARLRAQAPALTLRELAPDTALISGGACNVLVRKAQNGELMVIDGGLSDGARELRRTMENGLGKGRITTLLNTHWHPEQTGLNAELGNRATRIFAHENTRQWLSTPVKRLWQDFTIPALPAEAQPNDTFYTYGDFKHGDVPVEYGYLRQAHTDGDMYVFLPADNVLHAGGVIATDGWPFMDWWTGGWIGGVTDAVDTLLDIANDDTVIVPATGPVTNRAELVAMRAMYADLYTQVRDSFMAANTVEQTVAAKPAAAFEAKYGNADEFIALSHWSLIPHLTPDA